VSYEPQQKGEHAMKRMGIVLLGAVCLISSYAFSHASDIHFKKISSGEVVEFAWDETTKLNDREGLVIGYTVCITKDKNDESKYLKTEPTIEQTISISFALSPGIYYVGVKSAFFKNTNLKSKLSLDTEISWSDNEDCTNRNPFAVKVEN